MAWRPLRARWLASLRWPRASRASGHGSVPRIGATSARHVSPGRLPPAHGAFLLSAVPLHHARKQLVHVRGAVLLHEASEALLRPCHRARHAGNPFAALRHCAELSLGCGAGHCLCLLSAVEAQDRLPVEALWAALGPGAAPAGAAGAVARRPSAPAPVHCQGLRAPGRVCRRRAALALGHRGKGCCRGLRRGAALVWLTTAGGRSEPGSARDRVSVGRACQHRASSILLAAHCEDPVPLGPGKRDLAN
mmetsp:Transcript_69959/g.226259  ORF Transcript_69959/g.226259 Transcript_69959/m.226259 type:complete len:249 (+) Transcript_69959:764-1510(+)